MKPEEKKREAVPVMKQLARPMSKEELESVAGAGCAPSSQDYTGGLPDAPDYQF